MTGKTHRVGGMLGGLVGFSVLKRNGLLVEEISEPLQMVLMYASSMYGSVLSDMDHDWSSCPSKDVFSWLIYRLIHLTTPIRKWLNSGGKIKKKIYGLLKGLLEFGDAKHRSWQTHSDLTLVLVLWGMIKLPTVLPGTYDGILITVIGEGILFGVISHLCLDLLTTDGIWSFVLSPIKILKGGEKDDIKDWLARLSFVPDIKFFSTKGSDAPWERLVRFLMYIAITAVMVWVVYMWSPYRIEIG